MPGGVRGPSHDQPVWLLTGDDDPVVLTGEALATWGVQPPVLWPETGVLVHLEAVDDAPDP